MEAAGGRGCSLAFFGKCADSAIVACVMIGTSTALNYYKRQCILEVLLKVRLEKWRRLHAKIPVVLVVAEESLKVRLEAAF